MGTGFYGLNRAMNAMYHDDDDDDDDDELLVIILQIWSNN